MKIKVNISRSGQNQYLAVIAVRENHDFPTIKIFQTDRDFPANMHYQLFPGNTSMIQHYLPDQKTAQDWVDAQVTALETHITDWRKQAFNKEYEVEI
jgi:hypothetical protein